MKGQKSVFIIFICLFLFAFLIPAFAQESEIEALKREVRQLQERIKALEERQIQPLQEKVKILEQQKAAPLAELRSKLGDLIEIGGELEFEYVDTQNDDIRLGTAASGLGPKNPNPHFQMDQIRLKVKVEPQENIEFKFKLDFENIEDEVDIDEAYLTFKNIGPFEQKISLGLKDRFIGDSIERITEGSPLARTAFYKDPDLGIQYSGKKAPFYWHLSLTNGMRLEGKEIGEDATEASANVSYGGTATDKKWIGRDDLLHDDGDQNEDYNTNKQVGLGLGYETNFGKIGMFNILGFSYFSRLSNDDLNIVINSTTSGTATTAGVFPDSPSSTKRRQVRAGFNLAHTKDAWENYAQYIRAQDGYLRRHIWMLQTSYKFDTDMKYLKAIQPLYRYDYYIVRTPHANNSPLTWDRRRHTFGLLNYIRDNLILKLEYAHNLEETGGDTPRNDELLAQLEYKF